MALQAASPGNSQPGIDQLNRFCGIPSHQECVRNNCVRNNRIRQIAIGQFPPFKMSSVT